MKIKTLFVSDLHLGSRFTSAKKLLKVLDKYKPETIYLVGDILDGWRMRKLDKTTIKVVRKLLRLASNGVKIKYAIGNHDAFMRNFAGEYGNVEIAEFFVHKNRDKQFLVLHGDVFDVVEQKAKWLSKWSTLLYDLILLFNFLISFGRSFGFCGFLKSRVKGAVQFCSGFRRRMISIAGQFDGLICGHVHMPLVEEGEFSYYNTGDWVEHKSYLIEHSNGEMELCV